MSKNKTKVITTTNQKKRKYFESQWELEAKPTKLRKAREDADGQVVIGLVLHLIGWEIGVRFQEQSQSEVKLKQSNAELLSTHNLKLL